MKNLLKIILLLTGVSFFIVTTAWAQDSLWVPDVSEIQNTTPGPSASYFPAVKDKLKILPFCSGETGNLILVPIPPNTLRGIYIYDRTIARVNGTFTTKPFAVNFDIVYDESTEYCSWNFQGNWNAETRSLDGAWTHIGPQFCGSSGSISFNLGRCN